MTKNNDKKKLSLNKETLLRLQEQQLKASMGGQALMSNGHTAQCPSVDTCTCNPDEPATCCKKSCRD